MGFRRLGVEPRVRGSWVARYGSSTRRVLVPLGDVTAAFPAEPDPRTLVDRLSGVSGVRAHVSFGGAEYALERYASERWPRDGDASVGLDAFAEWLDFEAAATLLHYRRRVTSFGPLSMLVDARSLQGGIVGQLVWHRGSMYAAQARYRRNEGRLAALTFAVSLRAV